jgi:hypothetical protein
LLFSVVWLGAALAAEPRAFDVAIKAGEPARTLRVKRGDDVELRWSSDRRIQLHLHGYDIERAVEPQAPTVMAFKASIAGRFPVSEHGHGARHGRTVLYLEVHP